MFQNKKSREYRTADRPTMTSHRRSWHGGHPRIHARIDAPPIASRERERTALQCICPHYENGKNRKNEKLEILARWASVELKSTLAHRGRFPISVLVFENRPRSGPIWRYYIEKQRCSPQRPVDPLSVPYQSKYRGFRANYTMVKSTVGIFADLF